MKEGALAAVFTQAPLHSRTAELHQPSPPPAGPPTFRCVGRAQHAPLGGLQRTRARHLARLLKLGGDARHHAHRADEGQAGQHLQGEVLGGWDWGRVKVRVRGGRNVWDGKGEVMRVIIPTALVKDRRDSSCRQGCG